MFFETLNTVFAFIITLGILVTFHEFGHFYVARCCKVRVLRFSVGFGKPIFSWYDSHKTEFCISIIPLGGYVKMLDEREVEVSDKDKPYSFLSQPAYKKIAIVAAGPIANFLLSVLLLWAMYLTGVRVMTPIIGEVTTDSIAYTNGIQADDIITSINDKPVVSWQKIELQLLTLAESQQQAKLKLQRNDLEYSIDLKLDSWHTKNAEIGIIEFLGITPKGINTPAILGEIVKDAPADQAGLISNDKILAVNNSTIDNWQTFVDIIRANPEETLVLLVKRNAQELFISITPEIKLTDDGKIGYIGCKFKAVADDSIFKIVQYNPITALAKGIEDTCNLLGLTAISIWNMLKGLISVKNLGGPITIAKIAGVSMTTGLDSFLYFLAMLSVSLGFINLLPIPALDGGHLLFHCIEWAKGSPVSEKVQMFFLRIGVSIIVTLMIFSIFNDLMRNL